MSSNVNYSRRLENMDLLDGNKMDILDVSAEFRKDCIKLLRSYVVFFLVSMIPFVCVVILREDVFADVSITLQTLLLMAIFSGMVIFYAHGIVGLWKAIKKNAFRGIRGTCDNVVKNFTRYGCYHVYHCTTEFGEQGFASVNGIRQRASVGDEIVYIRIVDHDLIYIDKRTISSCTIQYKDV